MCIFSRNLNGEHIPATVQLEISELKAPQRILRERLWKSVIKICIPKEYVSLFPMMYANENDASTWEQKQWYGRTVNGNWFCHLLRNKIFSREHLPWNSKKIFTDKQTKPIVCHDRSGAESLPVTSLDWFYVLKDDAVPGQNDQVLIGCSEKCECIVWDGIKMVQLFPKKDWVKWNQQRISIPVKEQYRGNFTVHFTFMKHGRAFTYLHTMKVPPTIKRLQFSYETFRFQINPRTKGGMENWYQWDSRW